MRDGSIEDDFAQIEELKGMDVEVDEEREGDVRVERL